MKIAYLFQEDGRAFEKPYAAHVHITHIIRGLQKRGHDVSLMTLYGSRAVLWTSRLDAVLGGRVARPGDFATMGVTDHPLFKAAESAIRRAQVVLGLPYLAFFDTLRFREACLRHLADVDVVHERYKMQAAGASLAMNLLRAPYVLEVNGDAMGEWALRGRPVTGIRRRYATWATHRAYRQADRLICVSNELRAHLAGRWGVDQQRITVLPNGADVEKFGRPVDSEAIRAHYGIDGQPVVTVVGGFYEWHDLGLLLECFTRAKQMTPKVSLVLVGDGDTYAAINQRTRALGLQESVKFTGQIPHDCVPEILAVSDIAVVPMRKGTAGYGASPLKLYEYMAAGKAIIAARTGQNAEVIEHGHTGLLYEPGNADDLTSALSKLMGDSELRRILGQNARREAVENHSWDNYAEKLERIYESALQAGR